MRDDDPVGADGAGARGDPLLFRREASRLRRFFKTRLGGSDEVGDLVQETFARLAGRRSAQPLENPAAYLQRVARNLLIDRARRRSATPPHVSIGGEGCPELPARADQGDQIEAEQLMSTYRIALDALPRRTREVFLLHRVGELGYREIAARLGISVRTVEWHIEEALVRIRRTLNRG